MKKISIVLISIVLLLLVSCSNQVEAPDETWEDIFLQYWNAMNNEYVHFSEDTSYDWDKVYEKYLPLFQALDYTKSDDSIKAFKYFKEIAYGVHDNHYNLTVADGFGNTLKTSPALLKKYAAAKEGNDIMDFPDVTIKGTLGDELVTINHPDKDVTAEERRKIYKEAIPSVFEVENLIAGKDITDTGKDEDSDDEESTAVSDTVEDTKYGYFHSADGNITTEFPNGAYYGGTFEAYTSAEIARFTQGKDSFYATEWNYVVNAIGISSYFYGVNKDDAFYVYFSDFGSPLYLVTDILTKSDDELTEEEEKALEENSQLSLLRQFTRGLFEDYLDEENPIKDVELKKRIGDGLDAILNLQNMFDSLRSVTSAEDGKEFEIKFSSENGSTERKVTAKDVKGVIVDLRGNGGGAVSFLSSIWGSFFSSERQFGYVRYKSGYSRYDYTPWVSFNLESDYVNKELTSDYSKPVAVLVNGFSVSCSEVSCIIARLLPNAKIIGHTTFGGTCALTDRTIYNSGPFKSEHLYIYTTTYQFKDIHGTSFETIGITPDKETELNPTSDNAYESAVKWVTTEQLD